MIGKCGLCQKQAALKKSHLLPAGLFKAVAQGHAPHDDAPVLMDIPKGVAVQSNDQARKPFLCDECEQLFSKNGESHVISQCHRKDGEFRLRDTLKQVSPSHVSSGRAIFYDKLPYNIDSVAFLYFALSVLWRASATEWPKSTGVKFGALGRYEENIRLYLLGQAPVPDVLSVSVYVNFEPNPTVFLAYPTHGKNALQGRCFTQHSLHIPGIRFIVWIGRSGRGLNTGELQAQLGQLTFFEWRPSNTEFHERLGRDVAGLTAKGKLAREP